MTKCIICNGDGKTYEDDGVTVEGTCPVCNGSGKV